MKKNNSWRKIDNVAKIFSLEDKNNNNVFRLSIILKEKINPKTLTLSVIKALNTYPSYKVKIKTGFFWNYLEVNHNLPIIEKDKDSSCKSIDFSKNNDYLFRVTYYKNKINLDIFHVLTDGVGATTFLKEILYNYLDLNHHLNNKGKSIINNNVFIEDEYINKANKKLLDKTTHKKAFLIDEKINLLKNKTYHYVLNLKKFKDICKKNNVTITEYLTTLYIYAIYKTIYDKSSKKDISITIPIDLRKYYNTESHSNFFTCMNINGNVSNNQSVSFKEILNIVHKQFKSKLTQENISKYLARDVKLGTNIVIKLVPLSIKKMFIKSMNKVIHRTTTTTLSNLGSITIKEQYKKYIENIIALVNPGPIQKVKCTVCSYENKLTVTINSNLINNKLENEFRKLLTRHIGLFKVQTHVN